ncbi:isopenicillin N synthase family dioxygenase [Phytomonospora endophytica]|uniref:Isopenicillin N synthase-like dioxygenase n=1 Tax=Phytomonospora endophytica TaxID=714109 RepID=A0A841FAJ6_9ACTN|nr:isopenicillin N synthase family oxygenase [Phytomonospora endophytica]MBB6034281.1 isopenicillin N synthase-like dioxygenase [Phytomonospora endophytica]GIG66674.1 2OG-Fe(II) oxygenase [Phytomonospora endophytica]
MPNYVPVIDLSTRDTPEGRAALAATIGEACATSGFYVIVGHGVAAELVTRMYTVTRSFFLLPDAGKDLVANRPGVSGFRRLGGSTAASIGEDTPPDLCEVFAAHVTGELPDAERAALGDAWATWTLANVWPSAEFKDVWWEYMDAVTALAADLMRLSALALGLDEEFFASSFGRHGSSVAANYYYPQTRPPLPGQLRRGPHTDFGGLTVLYQEDDRSGLQVRGAAGEWRDVAAIPGSFVVNIGDLMALWTGGRWVSTMHRVVNPPPEHAASSRVSIPFFYLPDHDAVIKPVEGGGEAVVAGEWMSRKLERLFTGVG